MDLRQVIATSPICDIPGEHYVVRLNPDDTAPNDCFCVTQDADEITVICREDQVPRFDQCEREGPFAILQCRIVVPFQAPGFLAKIASVLSAEAVSVFIVSTYSFDYVLVAAAERSKAIGLLRAAGFPIGV